MRRTTSRGPVLLVAFGVLTSWSAGAADGLDLSGYLVRCSQDPAAPADPPPAPVQPEDTAEAPSETADPGPPDQGTGGDPRAPEEAEIFARVGLLLQSRCAMPGCHLGPEAQQGLRLNTAWIYRSSVNVPSRSDPRLGLVVPGAPDQSLLYLKLLPPERGQYRGARMPRGMDPLSDEEIRLVRAWIEAFPEDRWGPPPEAETAGRPSRTFQDSSLINLPGPDPLGGNTLEFRILHRFQSSVRDSGSHDFYGLDSGAWISIGLAYGLSDSFELGLRRTNLQHDYEAYGKWTPIRQTPGRSPLSVALRGSFSNIREKGAFNTDRHGLQAVLARRSGERLSLMLVPTYVTNTNYLDPSDTRGTTALGLGAEWRLSDKAALTGEWITQLGGVKNDFESGSIGYSIATARHGFHIFITNTAGSHTDLYAPGGDLDAGRGYFRLGFNISRTYTPR